MQETKYRLELAAAAECMQRAEKLVKRAKEEQQSGKKKAGRKPVSPDAVANYDRKANTTDSVSQIIKNQPVACAGLHFSGDSDGE